MHEAFYLLPENLLVIPGVFRISDAFFVILPFFVFTLFRTFSRYRVESLLVLSFCAMTLLNCLMGHIFFGQTYVEGLLHLRRNFFWLSFFMFIPLIRNLDQVEKLLNLLTLLFGIYTVVLLLTQYFPDMGLIHFTERYYSRSGSTIRFGEYRLFFPYVNIPIMLYCIALAELIHGKMREDISRKTFLLLFAFLIMFAVLSTYTRAVIYSLLIATAFAFFTSNRRKVKGVAIAMLILLGSIQVLSIATSGGGLSFLEESKLGKIVLKSGKLETESGRLFQAKMYWNQFMKSPIVGVGDIAITKYLRLPVDEGIHRTYRQYGFFSGSDLGYLKILGEYGILGIAWLIWFFSYYFRRRKETLKKAQLLGNIPYVEVICYGFTYFIIYIMISAITLPQWVHPNWITILPLSLAIIAFTRVNVSELASKSSYTASKNILK
jgi:hypothetical protein